MHCASIFSFLVGLASDLSEQGAKFIEVSPISLISHVCQNTTLLSQSPFHPPSIWGVLFW